MNDFNDYHLTEINPGHTTAKAKCLKWVLILCIIYYRNSDQNIKKFKYKKFSMLLSTLFK